MQNTLDYERETNRHYRAQKLEAILFERYDEHDPAATLTDLLADARHFADRHGLNFGERDRVAYDHYLQEAWDEDPDASGSLELIAEMVGLDEPEQDEDDQPIEPF